MQRLCKLILILSALNLECSSQNFLHLTGKVFIDHLTGRLEAKLNVSGLSPDKEFIFALNKNFKVEIWEDTLCNLKVPYQTKSSNHEGLYYSVKGRKSFSLAYEGSWMVYSHPNLISGFGDWKGNIAFNGNSVRATEQSCWYPVAFDKVAGKLDPRVTYDLLILSPTEITTYISGSDPGRGKQVHMQSTEAQPLMLFAGDYKVSESSNRYLNPNLSKQQQQVFDTWIDKIKRFYSERLCFTFEQKVNFIETTPVSERNSWAFYTHPSITVINHHGGISSHFKNDMELNDSVRTLEFFSHEIAHYYFGQRFSPYGDLRWVFLEGIPSYLSIKFTSSALNNSTNKIVEKYIREVSEMKDFISLSSIKHEQQISSDYRYYYFPLILLCIEHEMGEKFMWQWLNVILKQESANTDYDFFRMSLREAGMTHSQWQLLEKKFILGNKSVQQVLDKISEHLP